MKRIAVFGSAFNPPHRGHADAIRQLLPEFNRILVIPNAAHAFGKAMVSFEHRLQMTRLLVAEFFPGAAVEVSDIEQQMALQQAQQQPIYSYDLLCALRQRYPEDALTLVVGPDNRQPATWQRFYRYQDIETEFAVFTVAERLPFRSSSSRDKLAGLPCSAALLPFLQEAHGLAVARYIVDHQLYCTAGVG